MRGGEINKLHLSDDNDRMASINQAAENGGEDGGVLLGPNGEKATRNETLQPMTGKPNSAVLNKRVPLQTASGQQMRPDSKQGSTSGGQTN